MQRSLKNHFGPLPWARDHPRNVYKSLFRYSTFKTSPKSQSKEGLKAVRNIFQCKKCANIAEKWKIHYIFSFFTRPKTPFRTTHNRLQMARMGPKCNLYIISDQFRYQKFYYRPLFRSEIGFWTWSIHTLIQKGTKTYNFALNIRGLQFYICVVNSISD